MNDLDLTPPTNGKKEKAPKAAKAPKEPKVAKDPNAPKAPRAPRVPYGYADSSVITLTGKDGKYRGARKAWFDSVIAFNGKTVKEWEESRKAEKDPPRGWMRFFVQDGTVSLVAVAVEAAPAADAKPN